MKNRYQAVWDSVRQHRVPEWYEDCKFGIFIHWGAYSVPAFAPMNAELGEVPIDEEWFCNNPYAEWYMNSVNVGRGPTYEHHTAHYGVDFAYENFAEMWRAENWKPQEWARSFKKSGAKYVVLTTKHHDGLCLFNTALTDYNTTRLGPRRDIMGELTRAVRDEGLHMGAYYSGIIDWRFCPDPIFDNSQTMINVCPTYEYADYAYKQVRELIDLYRPSILWNDIGWPERGVNALPNLLAHYYNTVEEGVINDRWNGLIHDFTTAEYQHGERNRTVKWEMTRGMALSFGYNASESTEYLLTPRKAVSLLVSTVANNGNLLLNVGPKADGTIPPEQEKLLEAIGEWLAVNGEAIYGTRPSSRESMQLENGIQLHFTATTEALYIILDQLPPGESETVIPGLSVLPTALQPGNTVSCSLDGASAKIKITGQPPDGRAIVLKAVKAK